MSNAQLCNLRDEKTTFKILTKGLSKLLFGQRSKNFAAASGDASHAGKQEIRNVCAKSELDAVSVCICFGSAERTTVPFMFCNFSINVTWPGGRADIVAYESATTKTTAVSSHAFVRQMCVSRNVAIWREMSPRQLRYQAMSRRDDRQEGDDGVVGARGDRSRDDGTTGSPSRRDEYNWKVRCLRPPSTTTRSQNGVSR